LAAASSRRGPLDLEIISTIAASPNIDRPGDELTIA